LGNCWVAIGAGTALMRKEAAMTCTEAVETVIGDHYNEQLRELYAFKILAIKLNICQRQIKKSVNILFFAMYTIFRRFYLFFGRTTSDHFLY
jgi:hypothetical protein